MKVKAAFSQIIQPKLVQYMIEKYGYSYDTFETVKDSWRKTYPISDEIVEEVFVQIRTIEKVYLEPREYKRESYQSLLTEIIADNLSKYIKRCDTYKDLTRDEVIEIIKQKIDISENKHKGARFVILQSTLDYLYIKDVSETEKNITTDPQTVLWHVYKHNALGNRRLFYRDTLGNISEIKHHHGIFQNFAAGHFDNVQKENEEELRNAIKSREIKEKTGVAALDVFLKN